MAEQFKTGDCVQLRNGNSPKMTVHSVYQNGFTRETEVKCAWWDEKTNDFKYQTFLPEMLKSCTE